MYARPWTSRAARLFRFPRPAVSSVRAFHNHRTLHNDADANGAALEQHFRDSLSSLEPSAPPPPSPHEKQARQLESWLAHQHIQTTTSQYGSALTPGYSPSALLSNPPSASEVTLELLLSSGAHLGHYTSLWNPANARYIFGVRSGIHIISLDATAQHLRRAARVVTGVAERAGLILFVGTRPGFARPVHRAAQLAAPAYHVVDHWIPGAISNREMILGKCALKLVDELDVQVDLENQDQNMRSIGPAMPDLVVCLNPLENQILLKECANSTIPTIGVIDTDADPSWVTYPIPANDDSLRCIELIAGVLGNAGAVGQRRRLEKALQGEIVRKGRLKFSKNNDGALPRFNMETYDARRAERQQELKTTSTPEPSDPAPLISALTKITPEQKPILLDPETSASALHSLRDTLSRPELSALATYVSHLRAAGSPLEYTPEVEAGGVEYEEPMQHGGGAFAFASAEEAALEQAGDGLAEQLASGFEQGPSRG